MNPKKSIPIWIVVKVESGIPTCIHPFLNMNKAVEFENSIRIKMNEEKDETGIFEIAIENNQNVKNV